MLESSELSRRLTAPQVDLEPVSAAVLPASEPVKEATSAVAQEAIKAVASTTSSWIISKDVRVLGAAGAVVFSLASILAYRLKTNVDAIDAKALPTNDDVPLAQNHFNMASNTSLYVGCLSAAALFYSTIRLAYLNQNLLKANPRLALIPVVALAAICYVIKCIAKTYKEAQKMLPALPNMFIVRSQTLPLAVNPIDYDKKSFWLYLFPQPGRAVAIASAGMSMNFTASSRAQQAGRNREAWQPLCKKTLGESTEVQKIDALQDKINSAVVANFVRLKLIRREYNHQQLSPAAYISAILDLSQEANLDQYQTEMTAPFIDGLKAVKAHASDIKSIRAHYDTFPEDVFDTDKMPSDFTNTSNVNLLVEKLAFQLRWGVSACSPNPRDMEMRVNIASQPTAASASSSSSSATVSLTPVAASASPTSVLRSAQKPVGGFATRFFSALVYSAPSKQSMSN